MLVKTGVVPNIVGRWRQSEAEVAGLVDAAAAAAERIVLGEVPVPGA